MGLNGHFRINAPKVSHETIDGETLIINLDTGHYYSLLGVGADIWSLILRSTAVGDIVDAIHDQYNGTRTDIEKAIDGFLAQLQEEGLIVHDQVVTPERAVSIAIQVRPDQSGKGRAFEAPVLNKYTEMQDLLVLDPIHEVDETGWPTPADE